MGGLHRDFDAEARERAREQDPVTFTLNGCEFTLTADIPFGPVVALAKASVSGDGMAALSEISGVLTAAVVPEQRDAMAAAVDSVGLEQLGQVAEWIVEMATNRPTRPSSASAGGRSQGGPVSTSEPVGKVSAA